MRTLALVFFVACGTAQNPGTSGTDNLTDVGPAAVDTGGLDGQLFCRKVEARSHCVSFSGTSMRDNANTFFGNPPETLEYRLSGGNVQVKKGGSWKTVYTYADRALANDAGAVLRSTAFFDGYKYCRTVHSDGGFGQPAGDREHCLSFEGGDVTDNADTFFGNPPSTASYQLLDTDIYFDETLTYTYSAEDDSIKNQAGAVLTRK